MTLEVYTAGFLDADGSVSFRKDRNDLPDYCRIPCVEFYNCDLDMLTSIQEKWGGRIRERSDGKKNHNTSYELRIERFEALALLKSVVPYMRHKKKALRGQLLLDHYVACTPRNGKYSKVMMEKKAWLADQVMGIVMRGAGAY